MVERSRSVLDDRYSRFVLADPEEIVRNMAHRVLATLMTRREMDEERVVVQVERRRVGAAWSDFEVSDSADLFSVSFGYPGSSRLVHVDVGRGERRAASLAWAAWVIGDAFQDEVIELVHEARPQCPRHAHPMSITSDDGATSWHCPDDPAVERAFWP